MDVMNILKKKLLIRLTMAVALLLCYAGMATATNVSINDFSIKAGQTLEITLNLDTEASDITLIQGSISLPQGLTFVENAYGYKQSAKAEGSRIENAFANLNVKTGVIAVSSTSGKCFTPGTGAIAHFKVKATADLASTTTVELIDFEQRTADKTWSTVEQTINATVTLEGDSSDDGDDEEPASDKLFCSFAENPIAITAGETKDIEVLLTNGMKLSGFQAKLTPSEGLSIVNVTNGNRLDGWQFNNNRIMATGDITGNEGAIFTITLKANDSFLGMTNLKITNLEAGGKEIENVTLDVNVIPNVELTYSVSEFYLAAGEQKSVDVNLSTSVALSSFQAKFSLPDGISLEIQDGDICAPNYKNGRITGMNISGTKGRLFTMIVKADEQFSADGQVLMNSILSYTQDEKEVNIDPITLSIKHKTPAIVTDPIAENLIYTGNSVALIKAGSATGGELQYSLDGKEYSTTIPTATNAGSYTVYYKAIGDATHTDSDVKGIVVIIKKAAGSISFAQENVSKTFGEGTFSVELSIVGDGTVNFTSSDETVATVNADGLVTIVNAGSATITATVTEKADGNYAYATTEATYTVNVATAAMTATAEDVTVTYDGKEHTISVVADEGATVKYGVTAESCTLDAAPVYVNAGTHPIFFEVTKPNFSSVKGSATVTINKAAGSISFAQTAIEKSFGDNAFTNDLTIVGDGTVNFASSDETVATVNADGLVTIVNAGSATITATVTEKADGNYAYATTEAAYTINVAGQSPIRGDVDGSGEVTADDVTKLIDDILSGSLPTDLNSTEFFRYDANADGIITVADVQATMNLAVGQNADGSDKIDGVRLHKTEVAKEALMSIQSASMGNGITRYTISLHGGISITGLQMDVVTTQSAMVISEQLVNNTTILRSNNLQNGTHRILGMLNSELTAEGEVVYVDVQGEGSVRFENVVLTNAQAQSIAVYDSEITGIKAITNGQTIENCFDLNGRKVNGQKGLVILNGKKVVLK